MTIAERLINEFQTPASNINVYGGRIEVTFNDVDAAFAFAEQMSNDETFDFNDVSSPVTSFSSVGYDFIVTLYL